VVAVANAIGYDADSVSVIFGTVTVTPRTVVSKGTARLSSIITAKPLSCSSSPYASTMASSTSAAARDMRQKRAFRR